MARKLQRCRDRRAGLAQGAVVDLRHLGQDRPLGAQPDAGWAVRPRRPVVGRHDRRRDHADRRRARDPARPLDTGMRSQNATEQARPRARIRLANEGRFELVRGVQMARFLPVYRLTDKALVDEVMAMCTETGVEIYKRQEELAGVRVDRRPDLPKIKCPPIVVCGRDDVATPLAFSEEIATAIKSSELIVIEQCGHLITMEKPEETNAILRKWLS